MLRLAISFSLLFYGSICMAQSATLRPSWPELAGKSSTVVVGVIEDVSLVLRSDREISKVKPLPNGRVLVELQNPADYVIGRLARIRITEVIKQDANAKVDRTVNIFMPGFLPTEGQPALVQKESYLLFLSNLKTTRDLSDALVHEDTAPSRNVKFPTRNNYIVTEDAAGVVHVTSKTSSLVKQIKMAISNHRV